MDNKPASKRDEQWRQAVKELMSTGTLDADEFFMKKTTMKRTAKPSKIKPKPATEGEKIVCKCYEMTLCELRETSYERGFRRQAKVIDAAIKRAEKRVHKKIVAELVQMSFESRGVHHFLEKLERKYGVIQ